MDFSAESRGCAPCLLLSPQLEQVAKEYEGRIRVVKIDTDKCQALTSEMKVIIQPSCTSFLLFELPIVYNLRDLMVVVLLKGHSVTNFVFRQQGDHNSSS